MNEEEEANTRTNKKTGVDATESRGRGSGEGGREQVAALNGTENQPLY